MVKKAKKKTEAKPSTVRPPSREALALQCVLDPYCRIVASTLESRGVATIEELARWGWASTVWRSPRPRRSVFVVGLMRGVTRLLRAGILQVDGPLADPPSTWPALRLRVVDEGEIVAVPVWLEPWVDDVGEGLDRIQGLIEGLPALESAPPPSARLLGSSYRRAGPQKSKGGPATPAPLAYIPGTQDAGG